MNKIVAVLFLVASFVLQGCAIGVLAAGVGYGVGQGRKASAKMIEAKAQYVEKYQNYRVELEKVNLEREKAGLKPSNIPTFEEWLETQPLTASEIKLFKKYGVVSAKELKQKEEQQEATTVAKESSVGKNQPEPNPGE